MEKRGMKHCLKKMTLPAEGGEFLAVRREIQIYQKQKFPTENSYPLIDFGLFSVKFIENSYPSIDFSIFHAKISVNSYKMIVLTLFLAIFIGNFAWTVLSLFLTKFTRNFSSVCVNTLIAS